MEEFELGSSIVGYFPTYFELFYGIGTFKLGKDEKKLKEKIIKFREDELHHKEIAYDNGATKKGLFGLLDKVIKTSSRIAITISEKI